MNPNVKKAIDEKYNSIIESYIITDEALLGKLNSWYQKMNALGESATDARDFESKFASSELVREYSEVFQEIAQTCEVNEIGLGTISDEDEQELEKQWLEHRKRQFIRRIPIVGQFLGAKGLFNSNKHEIDFDDE